jgi:broad specificity phosphatase PhoE
VLKDPRNWRFITNPFRPSWGEPYARVALRMHAAAEVARELARGHEAVLVSHQLPIWVARLSAEHRHLWHDPRRRQCSLASVTSFTYEGDRMVSIAYTEPAADLLPGANPVPGA